MTRNFTLREAALLHEEKHPHGRARSDPTCVKHLVLLAEMTRWFGCRNFEWWFSVRMPQIQKMAVVALRRKHGWSKHPLVCFRFLDMHWECFVIKSAASKKTVMPSPQFVANIIAWVPIPISVSTGSSADMSSCIHAVPRSLHQAGKETSAILMFKTQVARLWNKTRLSKMPNVFFFMSHEFDWASSCGSRWIPCLEDPLISKAGHDAVRFCYSMPRTFNLRSTCCHPLPIYVKWLEYDWILGRNRFCL